MNAARKMGLAAGLAIALGLGGCFGGSDDDEPVTAGNGIDVPDSAGASVSSFLAYLLALSPSDESSEPSAIGTGFEVPADESNEPQPLT